MLSAAPPATAQSQHAGHVNQGHLISALNNLSAQVAAFNNLDEFNVIRTVHVEDVLNNNRVLNNVDVDAFQDFLNDNELFRNAFQDFLNENDVDVNVQDVVAIRVLSGGRIVIFQ